MIKYWIRLHEDKTNCILKAVLDENNKMHNNGQSSPTTVKFEALLPTPRILLHKFKFSFSIL
jgi:hypothetical protein